MSLATDFSEALLDQRNCHQPLTVSQLRSRIPFGRMHTGS
jgi:hypothetical protein